MFGLFKSESTRNLALVKAAGMGKLKKVKELLEAGAISEP